ncbi:MAG: cyclodeaminase/cyclohydrolase family protein [Bacteroidota bacterium]|nr:cyclodeaminase/cyclohydrolase family protein [Bacteroidota bacterium]
MNEINDNLELIEKEHAGYRNFLELPAQELLSEFGKGNHIPGSGSAAAFSGLMAIELLKTVLQLSIEKKAYESFKTEFELLLSNLIDNSNPKFVEYFNEDNRIFHKVSFYRRVRDNSTTEEEKNKYKEMSSELLKEATDIPLEMCRSALDLIPIAFAVFDNGFKSARGDSGVAISYLLSSAQGALFIVFLNLKSFVKSKWKDERMVKAHELNKIFLRFQREAYSKVVSLYDETPVAKQLELKFGK